MRRSPILFLLMAALAAPAAWAAAPTVPDVDSLRIKHERIVLPNGLTVLVHEDHSVPLVAVNVWYHVGSRDERRGRTGFAHLFEHFFFNGSQNYPHGFREAMDDLGANNRNGTTNTDRTNFFEDVPVSGLERTLYLEADRMGFLAGNINQEMLERERGVVQNEKRQGENQPYGRVFDRMVQLIYPYSHPYSWPTIGSMEDLQAAKLDDIKQWYATYYGPSNAVLALAGDITVEQARALATKYFGAIPPGPPLPRLQAWVPVLEQDLRDSVQDRVPQHRIYRAWHLPPMGERDTHAMELFASVLAGSESAPLSRRLVFDRKLATDVSASVWDKQLTSTFIVTVDVKPGVDPAEAERELDAVLARALAQAPAAPDLQRARSRYLADFARNSQRLGGFGGRSDVLAESETYFGDPEAYLRRLRDLSTLTPAQVQASAREWLGRHHATLTVAPAPELRAGKDEFDRKLLPALGAPPQVDFPKLQRTTLSNGLKVMLLERHSAPLVSVALAVDAGVSADPADAPGTSRFALDLLLKGTATRDAFRLADERDALGATLNVGNSLDQSLVYLTALRPNLGGSLDLLADVARNPAFPEDMVEIQRKQQLAAIEQQRASPTGAATRTLPPLLYGPGHAYGNAGGSLGRETTISALPRSALQAWHARWFVPGNATLIVAGDVTLDALKPELERAFGGWAGGTAPSKRLSAPSSPGRGKVVLIDRPDAPQSVILAAHLGPTGASDDDLALETVMRNFGGMATSRLNRNLRLEKHWSYGTSGGLSGARGPRSFVVVAPVQTDKTKESMVEVLKEIRGVAGARPLVGEEYESIMRSQVARLPGRFETLDSLVAAATDIANTGRAPEYYYDYAQRLRALDADALARAGKTVKPDELVWIVVGDLKKIEAGVRELNYGEVVKAQAD
ncbi:insulinase family protein [Lysobacter sp. 5GHs7-4]|uniref:M16 family metallopeptidase n=1 Tax=Lysobacter sp. 5GHs7-4 TaxID=2904253 RepID=UPI001E4F8BEE|nr:pitrilysin family protein [Lysobacter sp. 5GHs7-4]UHQ22178.1 insulinase family protein [Lysobacter sp. 5GHs7-4]